MYWLFFLRMTSNSIVNCLNWWGFVVVFSICFCCIHMKSKKIILCDILLVLHQADTHIDVPGLISKGGKNRKKTNKQMKGSESRIGPCNQRIRDQDNQDFKALGSSLCISEMWRSFAKFLLVILLLFFEIW